MNDKTRIPENHQEFCKAIGRLCRQHGIDRFHAQYNPSHNDIWDGKIEMSWEQGRHGEESDNLYLVSTIRVRTHLGKQP